MGTQLPRSPEAALKAPVKVALAIATAKLDRLVHHGTKDYADTLRHEAQEPGRHELAAQILLAVADTVHVEPPAPEEVYLECSRCDARVDAEPGEDLNDLMERVAYGDGQEPTGPKPWWSIDSDAGGIAYCPAHNHVNEAQEE